MHKTMDVNIWLCQYLIFDFTFSFLCAQRKLLIATQNASIKEIDLQTRTVTVLYELGDTAYSIDYDSKNRQVYFPRYFNNDIMRFGYPTGFIVVQKVVTTGNRPTGLALDSIHNHIYWTENTVSVGRIVRCDLDGSNVTVISQSLSYPFVIRLDVKNSWMYFVERYSKIYKSRLDFTGQIVIKNIVSDVICFDIDTEKERLYWIEEHTADLSSVMVDRSDLKTIINTNCKVSNAPICKSIAIDIFCNNIYFSNNNQLAVSNTSPGLGFIVLYNDTNRIDSIYSISCKKITYVSGVCI